MAKISAATKAIHAAHSNLSVGFQKAQERIADVPLGQQQHDPRTIQKYQDLLLGREPASTLDYQGASGQPKSRPAKRQPDKLGPARQSDKNIRAGRVVDPTAIESAQAADPSSPDLGSGPQEWM